VSLDLRRVLARHASAVAGARAGLGELAISGRGRHRGCPAPATPRPPEATPARPPASLQKEEEATLGDFFETFTCTSLKKKKVARDLCATKS
jgi:hypothetical protein